MNIALENLIHWVFERFSWELFPGNLFFREKTNNKNAFSTGITILLLWSRLCNTLKPDSRWIPKSKTTFYCKTLSLQVME